MDQTLRQLGELLLQSVPTILLFLVAYLGYRFIVHKPLVRILAERHARTQGAIEKARADVAAAEAKTSSYEHKLRDAKLAVSRAQEARRQKALQVRTAILNEAREQAGAKVASARAAIERDVEQAKAALQSDAERLASEVIATVLRSASLSGQPAGGGR
jgi:F-type H+-transporting ATPase subunit b